MVGPRERGSVIRMTPAEQLISKLKEQKDAENLADRRRAYFAEHSRAAAQPQPAAKRPTKGRTRKTRDGDPH